MLSAKSGKVTLLVGVYPKAANVGVVVSWPAKLNWFALKCLKNNQYGNSVFIGPAPHQYLDETALAYSVYCCAKQALRGGARSISSNVASINCSYRDNHFNINFATKGNAASVRKAVNTVLACMAVDKLKPVYSNAIRLLRGKPGTKERFNHACNELHKGMKTITVAVVGKINVNRTVTDKKTGAKKKIPVAKTMLDFVKSFKTNKIDEFKKMTPEVKYVEPGTESECKMAPYAELKTSQMGLLMIKSYIKSKAKLPISTTNNSLLMYTTKWDGYKSKLKPAASIKLFTAREYLHPSLKDTAARTAYLGVMSGFSAPTVKKMMSFKYTPENVKKIFADLK